MFKYVLALALLLSSVVAFSPAIKSMKMAPLSLFGGKKAAASGWTVGEGSANKGAYVPEGITAEAYAKQVAAEKAKADAKKKKFKIGKEPETLTEWQIKAEKKFGKVGADVRQGHRLVKAKYEEFYVKEDVSRVNRGQ